MHETPKTYYIFEKLAAVGSKKLKNTKHLMASSDMIFVKNLTLIDFQANTVRVCNLRHFSLTSQPKCVKYK